MDQERHINGLKREFAQADSGEKRQAIIADLKSRGADVSGLKVEKANKK